MPLLAVLALLILAISNLRALGLLAAAPAALLGQVLVPLVLALVVVMLVMRNGKNLVDKPQLAAELSVPWH